MLFKYSDIESKLLTRLVTIGWIILVFLFCTASLSAQSLEQYGPSAKDLKNYMIPKDLDKVYMYTQLSGEFTSSKADTVYVHYEKISENSYKVLERRRHEKNNYQSYFESYKLTFKGNKAAISDYENNIYLIMPGVNSSRIGKGKYGFGKSDCEIENGAIILEMPPEFNQSVNWSYFLVSNYVDPYTFEEWSDKEEVKSSAVLWLDLSVDGKRVGGQFIHTEEDNETANHELERNYEWGLGLFNSRNHYSDEDGSHRYYDRRFIGSVDDFPDYLKIDLTH